MNNFPESVRSFLAALGKWASFAYLLRFAILLWLFAPLLCVLNMFSATLTSGILVSEVWEQYLCVSFFLVAAACSALVLARIALIYGPERLDLPTVPQECRPPALKNLLVNDDGEREFLALFVSQVPNLFVFGYLIRFGSSQGVALSQIIIGLALGALLACIFWWNANAWYYVTYRALDYSPSTFILGQNAARTILFPRAMFGLNRVNDHCPGKVTIEQAHTVLSRPFFATIHKLSGLGLFIGLPGYEKNRDATSLYEAHNFAIISLFIFGGLYLLLWPLTAPVGAPVASWIAIAALAFFILFVLWVFWSAKPIAPGGKVAHLRKIQIWNTATIFIFFLTVLFLYLFTQIERFPIFATVLILIIAVSWMLGALAFFFAGRPSSSSLLSVDEDNSGVAKEKGRGNQSRQAERPPQSEWRPICVESMCHIAPLTLLRRAALFLPDDDDTTTFFLGFLAATGAGATAIGAGAGAGAAAAAFFFTCGGGAYTGSSS